jgi:hypothetical protein
MDMSKYCGEHFVKVNDVRNGPIEGRIVDVTEGEYGPNVVLDTGDVLSLNKTNARTLVRSYGTESDRYLGKMIRLLLGESEYRGSRQESVIIEPISPTDVEPEAAVEKEPPPFDDNF